MNSIKNTKKYISVWLLLSFFFSASVKPEETASREYQIKAAFLYNFLKFVEWPKNKAPDGNEPIIISIIGKDVFKNAFVSLEHMDINGRKAVIRKFKGYVELEEDEKSEQHPQIEDIKKSHLLFICPSEKKHMEDILKSVKNNAILTVADTEGFLKAGGIINLLTEEQKVRFEVNITAAKEAEIEIRSKLLRLAKRTVQ